MVKSYYYIPDDEEPELIKYTKNKELPVDVPYLIVKLGQSDLENTILVQTAEQKDWWFHLAKFPSAHALTFFNLSTVDFRDYKFDKDSLIKTLMATLVKDHSKQKNMKNVKLHYCQRKNLKIGDKPGLVILKKPPSTISV